MLDDHMLRAIARDWPGGVPDSFLERIDYGDEADPTSFDGGRTSTAARRSRACASKRMVCTSRTRASESGRRSRHRPSGILLIGDARLVEIPRPDRYHRSYD